MKIIIKTIVLIVLLSVTLFSQSIRLYGGYTSFDLSDQKSQFSQIVNQFIVATNIDIPIQENLPPNYMLSGSIDIPLNNEVVSGFIFNYGKTNSYALYGDILGDVDITSDFEVISFGGFINLTLSSFYDFKISAGVKAYVGSYDFKVSMSIAYPEYPSQNISSSDSYSGKLLSFEPHVILDYYIIDYLLLSTQIGYRIGTEVDSDDNEFTEEPPISTNGYVFLIGLGYVF